MNKKGKKQIEEIITGLEGYKSQIENLQNEEEEKFDNMPEGLQESERGEVMQDAIDNLSSAADGIEESIGCLQEIL